MGMGELRPALTKFDLQENINPAFPPLSALFFSFSLSIFVTNFRKGLQGLVILVQGLFPIMLV